VNDGGTATGGVGAYASLGLLLAVGVLFFIVAMTANRLLLTSRPSAAKSTTYECGLDPVGGDWAQAQIRYYVYAYLYVLFAVEAVFLFPWAVIFDRPGLRRDRGGGDGHLRRECSRSGCSTRGASACCGGREPWNFQACSVSPSASC
jgi:NADH-quinone oxidoreductase subunit A